tara:strand:+ start:198 stop:488 length:291 start_codon:yes stop_codon:yes gene_type:complete
MNMSLEKLEKFKKRILNLKVKQQEKKYKKIKVSNYSIAVNITIELLTGISLGAISGIFLDNYLQTKPLMLIICIIFGTIIGFFNMFKTLKKYGYFR